MKRIAFAALVPVALVACAVPLNTLPPSDHYTRVESPAPTLNAEEQRLVNDINKELDRLGLPAATVGGYECNVAAVMANVALAKIWNGSGRKFAVNKDVVAPTKMTEEVTKVDTHGSNHADDVTNEEDDAELKHLHQYQHQVSYGLSPMFTYLFSSTHAQTALTDDDVQKLVRDIYPTYLNDLKLGVAVLSAGDADKRLWAIALEDHALDLEKGPPRTTTPGASFDIAGTVVDKKIAALRLGLLGPDGKAQLMQVPLDAHGNFATTVTLPSAPGVYMFELSSAHGSRGDFWVPIFAGVAPTPWPLSPDPKDKTPPPDGTRAVAKLLAKTIADYRKSHGLKELPIDADLSAFSKSEAGAFGKAIDDSTGPGAATAQQDFEDGQEARVHAAGFTKLGWHHYWATDEYVTHLMIRFPFGPFLAAELASPTLEAIGIGVALVPNAVRKDDDYHAYSMILTLKDPTPPELKSASAPVAPTASATPSAPAPK